MNLPHLGYGLGLRAEHWDDILRRSPREVEWFEIISENFMNNHGHARNVLAKIRENYPIAMHGVSLSIGSSDELDRDYITKLKALAEWLEPAWISDHICWTGINHTNTHDLLPVPYTQDALAQMVRKTQQLQDFLGRQILLENPSNYMEFAANTLSEWEFVTELLEQADCLLLLDINNIYVTCFNHRLDPKTYIDAIPAERIGQIHLAGHEHHGTHIIDTHDDHVSDEVLALYAYAIQTKGVKNTMIEWDSHIPDFPTMLAELEKVKTVSPLPLGEAEELMRSAERCGRGKQENGQEPSPSPVSPFGLSDLSQREGCYDALMQTFQISVLKREEPTGWVREKPDFSSAEQMNIYQYAYRKRLFDAIKEDYPQTREGMGEAEFDLLLRTYIEHTPSQFYAMEPYIHGFATFLKGQAPEHAALAQLEVEISCLREQPQPPTLTPEDLAKVPPEGFLSLNLSLTPAAKLLSDQLLLCQKLKVHAYEIEPIEHEVLAAIDACDSLEAALHQLYEEDHCTAENVLPTLQQVLVRFMSKGVFVRQ